MPSPMKTFALLGGTFGTYVALSALGSPAAFADCQNPVGTAGTFVCTDLSASQPVPVIGGEQIVVGGGSAGGGTIETPALGTPGVGPVSTPPVTLESPDRICYFLDCVEQGDNLASVPSEAVGAGSIGLLPATAVPIPSVPLPIIADEYVPESAPVPAITIENAAVDNLEEDAAEEVETGSEYVAFLMESTVPRIVEELGGDDAGVCFFSTQVAELAEREVDEVPSGTADTVSSLTCDE